jgi:hypothetical protein
MTVFRPTTDDRHPTLMRAVAVVLVCVMGGACNFLNTSFAVLAARTTSFPEEEDHTGKDRSALVAASQPSRKGSIRPKEDTRPRVHRPAAGLGSASAPATSQTHRSLTGAGIFQRC